MINLVTGDILESTAQTLVVPVNCIGVAGKGLAKEFGQRYPLFLAQYQRQCAMGALIPGRLALYANQTPWIIALAKSDLFSIHSATH